MKIYYTLFDKICTFENFQLAYKNATKGKKWYKEVKAIEKYGVDKYLRELLDEVITRRYTVSSYINFQLWSGHKWRDISKLPMRDRIIQHAMMIYLEPIFRENFIIDTYASIKERGLHLALSRVKKALKTGKYKYQISMDIKKCYPSLDQTILKAKLADKFKDPDLLWLLYTIIDSCPKGVPIGNYTSQYFNNYYFSGFDHWIKEVKGCKAYFRYCDNIKILGETKEELRELFEEIKIKIAELNVSIKEDYQISPISDRGIDFVGYIIRPDYVRLRKATKKNFIKKVSKMDIQNLSDKELNVLGSYWGIIKFADCRHLWKTYVGTDGFKPISKEYKKRHRLAKKARKDAELAKQPIKAPVPFEDNEKVSYTTGSLPANDMGTGQSSQDKQSSQAGQREASAEHRVLQLIRTGEHSSATHCSGIRTIEGQSNPAHQYNTEEAGP